MNETKAELLSPETSAESRPEDMDINRVPRKPIGKVYEFERRLLRSLLGFLGNPPFHFVLWNGEEIYTSALKPVARVYIRDHAALVKLTVNPELHFGDHYSAERIEVEGNFVEFLETIYKGIAKTRARYPNGRLARQRNKSKARSNSLSGARDNIHHHYNIGNDFYRLWLDEQLLYTCAYFSTRETSLEQAQIAKMEHVCRKLYLKPGETVVEAGCGWGSLARYMAKHYGVKVRAYNISAEQIRYARERAQQEGLTEQVEYIEDDYRNIYGNFDAFVSVGMLEHVGMENYHSLGKVIDRSLKPHGRGLIHSIGRNKSAPMNAWIERRIFPGAYPPTLREMMEILEIGQFSVLDVENLRLHYAKTLTHWLQRFNKASDAVARMFDRRFVRTWRLYLAGSLAAFTSSDLQLFQVTFARNTNDIPWTRAYLYRPEEP